MLTDEQRAEGWIEHDGGLCPVPLDSKPGVLFADGYAVPVALVAAGYWVPSRWTRKRGPHQRGNLPPPIIAYRSETPND